MEVQDQKVQIEELEDAVQIADDARLRLEVNLQVDCKSQRGHNKFVIDITVLRPFTLGAKNRSGKTVGG